MALPMRTLPCYRCGPPSSSTRCSSARSSRSGTNLARWTGAEPVMTSHANRPLTPVDEQRPLLLVLGTGSRNYREYLLASISTRYRIHLLLGAEPTWEQDYLTGWTVLTQMGETIDATEMIAAARALAADRRLGGVLTWDEARVL